MFGLFGNGNRDLVDQQNAITDEEFPLDRECKTLREVSAKIRRLRGISESDRNQAIAGLAVAYKLLSNF